MIPSIQIDAKLIYEPHEPRLTVKAGHSERSFIANALIDQEIIVS